ncbi:MAG: chemotaxis protein CheA, partial [Bryobacteraceae bacterium]
MSSQHTSSGISDELRQALDRLAALAVAGDFADPAQPEAWRGLAEAAETVAARAGAAEGEMEQLALALAAGVRRIQNGEAPSASFETEVERQIAALQALAARTAAPAGQPVPGGPLFSGSLANDPELVSDFLMESREHLGSIEAQALILESEPSHAEAIHAMFRAFHTIKGLAGFLEFAVVQEVAHEIETLLDLARRGEVSIAPGIIDVVLESADYLSLWMRHIEAALGGASEGPPAGHDALRGRIRRFTEAGGAREPADNAAALAKLSASLAVPGAAPEPEASPGASVIAESAARRSGSELRAIKVDTAKLDYLVEMVGEMVIAQSLIRHDPDLAKLKTPRLVRNITQATRITGEVQKVAMTMRMVPIGHLFQRMTRLVRDIARKAGKRVELETGGEETELDRTIVEELADPLMHMVRNAVDHGIERPAERAAAGKAEAARVSLRASHQGGNILIEVADDGRGLDRERILAKARERGLLDRGDQLPDSEVFQLIFEPGFSTADRITDISGRGVGMDVVKKQVQKMRGRIDIRSTPGQG